MPFAKIFSSIYDLEKLQGNIYFLNKVMVNFRNSKWPLALVPNLDLKVGGHFEFTKSAITLSRKRILPWSFLYLIYSKGYLQSMDIVLPDY